MISVVISTACLGPRSAALPGSSGRLHLHRAAYLRDRILPRMLGQYDQVIVAGEYQAGDGYEYIHVPSRYLNQRDVLQQRELGFQAAKHDIIVFQLDDHLVGETIRSGIQSTAHLWDVLSPARRSLRDGRLLNCGWNDPREPYRHRPYLHTHVIVMKRHAVEQCPWSALPPVHQFDVVHTMCFRDAGLRLAVAHDLAVYDLEE